MVKGRKPSAKCQVASKITSAGAKMPDISVKSATLSPVNKMIVGKQKDRITDYFSPARSPVMADDADSAITSTAQHGLRSHQQHPMKSARLTRTSSSDVCQLQESDVQVINDKSVDCVVLDPGYRCEGKKLAGTKTLSTDVENSSQLVVKSSSFKAKTPHLSSHSDAESDDCIVIEKDMDCCANPSSGQGKKNFHGFNGFVSSNPAACGNSSYALRNTRSRSQKHISSQSAPTAALKVVHISKMCVTCNSSKASNASPVMNGVGQYSCCTSGSSSCSNSSCGSSVNGSSCPIVCDICDGRDVICDNELDKPILPCYSDEISCQSPSHSNMAANGVAYKCSSTFPCDVTSQSPHKKQCQLASASNGLLTDQDLLYSAVYNKRTAMMQSIQDAEFGKPSLSTTSYTTELTDISPKKRNHSDCTSPQKHTTPEVGFTKLHHGSPSLLGVELSNNDLIPSPNKKSMQYSLRHSTTPKNNVVNSYDSCISRKPMPLVVDLTETSKSSEVCCAEEVSIKPCVKECGADKLAALQPRLNHSSPTVRKLFTESKDKVSNCEQNKPVSDTSVAYKTRVKSACTSPTLRGNAALKTPPKSASSSTPSTPHKIQVIGNAEDLFLSPTTSNAMGRLSVCSPKQHPGVESKRTRGRKRLNMRPANAGVVVVDYTNSKMLDEASSTRSSIPDGSHDAVNSAHLGAKNWSPGSGSLNGFVRPVTRNAKMMQLQHSNDLKLNANKSTGNIIPDLINNKLDKTKGPAIDTINLTNGEDTSAKNKNAQMTDFFPIRRSERKPKATLMLERQMAIEKKILSGSEEGLRVEHFGEKGRGVVTTRMFRKGEFVVEYVGKLLDVKDAKLREQKYAMDSTMGCYMYYFVFNGVQYCIDGTEETRYLGRLVNHSRTNNNLVTKAVCVNGQPHLILLAKKDIPPDTELLYDYGDRSKEALANHPWLAF
ncbi:uncharacterized protein LOC108671795 [Hyalella azteca]|uniref:[histone H4]-lysine(20) N-methyltransferase n=1 Tax=Hyalella azteca TaxID=294128 RepID=A0A8B7NMH6_HYAAZ|nr:uncharacterized protein LOC108671795 [Hyalella azteca]